MIRPLFTRQQFKASLDAWGRRIEASIIRTLSFTGERCLVEMRTNKEYTDQTGNLTASGGYVVVANGRVVELAGFDPVSSTGSQGPLAGEKLARHVAGRFNNGYALIVVSGMNYAYHVEAMGYNVISSAEALAEREVPRLLKQLQGRVNKMG